MPAGDKKTRVDLRTVAPQARIAVATYASHLLRPGQAMEVTDERDPVDVFADLQHKSDRFRCQYVERGPDVWRIRVGRVQPSLTAGVTG
jgi:uncharacterized protein (DUF2249 family)